MAIAHVTTEKVPKPMSHAAPVFKAVAAGVAQTMVLYLTAAHVLVTAI